MEEAKAINTNTVSGSGNWNFQDIKDSNFNIFIGKSAEYQEMQDRLASLERDLAHLAPEHLDYRKEKEAEINLQRSQIGQFEAGIRKMYIEFNRIPTDTERLKKAKEYFDSGDFSKTAAFLESELESMKREQSQILQRKKEYEEEIVPKLKGNSEEFLMLALSAATNIADEKRFEKAREYFAGSIESFETKGNLFQYATILLSISDIDEADRIYQRYLKEFGGDLQIEEQLNICVNLGNLYTQQSDWENAGKYLTIAEALLQREDARQLPSYKENLAITNLNSGIFCLAASRIEAARDRFAEAARILEEIVLNDPKNQMQNLATSLANLGLAEALLKQNKEARGHLRMALEKIFEYEKEFGYGLLVPAVISFLYLGLIEIDGGDLAAARENLGAAKEIAEANAAVSPQFLLPRKALALDGLAKISQMEGKPDEARSLLEEGLGIMRQMEADDPKTTIQVLSTLLSGLASQYLQMKTEKEASIKFAAEAIRKVSPMIPAQPALELQKDQSMQTLKGWGLSDAEIASLIEAGA